DPILNTMQQEIKRSMPVLKKQKPPVYFMSYMINDNKSYNYFSSLGKITDKNIAHTATLDVDVRVGSEKMDNTRTLKGSHITFGRGGSSSRLVPLEDNAKVLQNILWQATESAVQQAQADYEKVKSNSVSASNRSDDSDDFSAPLAKKTDFCAQKEPLTFKEEEIISMLNEYSSLFKGKDFILSASVNFSVEDKVIYFVDSQGNKMRRPQRLIRLGYNLETLNDDGMELARTNNYDFTSMEKMPSKEQVIKDIKKSIEELRVLQNAPVAEPFHGPVILSGRAAGVFFHEILGHRMEGHRQKNDDFGQTFTGKINQQVIAPLISVYDDPTMTNFNNIALRGHYLYDDEAVPAQNVALIENGILKNFLMSRSPIKNFAQSNGHGRKDAGKKVVSRMGNTYVKASKTISPKELKAKLKEEIKRQNKPYGLYIEDISGGFTMIDTSSPQAFKVKPLLVYKVYPDKRADEIIRGVDIVGTPLASFNKIIAAGNDYQVFNGSCGAESGWVPVSAIAPSLLISELEIEKVHKSSSKLPVLKAPKGDK
ncbi:MAG: TldD/PmbA family protein, partial [Elusimicrobiaceae bacterium]|nr:TldD/PmbA family protein [Elusimicrobiaceae bacterium]